MKSPLAVRIAVYAAVVIAMVGCLAPLSHFSTSPEVRDLAFAARALGRTASLAAAIAVVGAVLAWPVARGLPAIVLLGWAMIGPIPRSLGVLALGMSPGSGAIIVAGVIGGLPWIALLLQLRLRAIDPSVLEAARNLGAGPWARWRRIEWPLARGTLGFAALWIALQSSGDVVTHELAGGGKVYSAALLLRDAALVDDAPALAVALLIGLVVIAVPVTVWVVRHLADFVIAEQNDRRQRAPRSWLGIGIALVAAAPLVAIMPQAVGPWSHADDMIATRIAQSLLVAAIVLALAVPLGAAVAAGSPRTSVRVAVVVVLPLVLPPVVYGFAALDLARTFEVAPGLLFTVVGTLPIAIALVFVASTIARPRVPPILVEAAANLGASPWSRLRRLWLPRMGPAWLAAAVMVVAWCWSDAAIAPFTSGPGEGTVAVAMTVVARGADTHTTARWAWLGLGFTMFAVLAAQQLWRARPDRDSRARWD